MAFLTVNKYFFGKNICASIVFDAESKPKHEEHFCLWGFLPKPKNALFGVSKMVLKKINFQKILIFVPPLEFFEYENFDAHAPAENLDLDF